MLAGNDLATTPAPRNDRFGRRYAKSYATAQAAAGTGEPDARLATASNPGAGDVCALCNQRDGDLEGDLLFPPFRGARGEPVWVHEKCALYVRRADIFL